MKLVFALLISLLLISLPARISMTSYMSFSFNDKIKIYHVNVKSINFSDENTYSELPLENISRFLNKIDKIFWDDEYGGYYHSVKYNTIYDDIKSLPAIAAAIGAYSMMYSVTGNSSYLSKINELVKVAEKFRYVDTGTYFMFMNRNFTAPIVDNPLTEINGHGSVLETIHYARALLEAYNATNNNTYLEIAKAISDAVFNNFWDPEYGGIASLADIDVTVKDPASQIGYFLLNLELYKITEENRYLERAIKELKIVDKLWYNGFYHTYSNDLSPLNTNRYPPGKVLTIPAYAYLVSYHEFKNETYRERALFLVNKTLFDAWDSEYGGFIWLFSSSWVPYDYSKKAKAADALRLYFISQMLDESNLRSAMKARAIGYLTLLLTKCNRSCGLPAVLSRSFVVEKYLFYSHYQFDFVKALLKIGLMLQKDNNKPILKGVYKYENGFMVKVTDLEGGITSVVFEAGGNRYVLNFSESLNAFVLPEVNESSGILFIKDSFGNTLEVQIEIENLSQPPSDTNGGEEESDEEYIPNFVTEPMFIIIIYVITTFLILLLANKISQRTKEYTKTEGSIT